MEAIQFWHWWILGLLLAALEILAPFTFFLSLAVAAALTGLVSFVAPISVQVAVALFAFLSMLSVYLWRSKLGNRFSRTSTKSHGINQGSDIHMGKVYTVTEAIENGRGKVKVGDTSWLVEGQDCPIGSHVQVIGTEGSLLKVKLVLANR